MKLGVFLPCLRIPVLAEALDTVAALGLEGAQLWNVGGPFDPSVMGEAERERLLEEFSRRGLEISALCGHADFVNPSGLPTRRAHFMACLDLAASLGGLPVTTESGRPAPETGPEVAWQVLTVTFRDFARHAEEVDATVCIEAGPRTLVRTIADLERLLEEVDSSALAVNLDPANLVMAGEDPVEAVRRLGPAIAHTHAKDGVVRADGSHGEVPLGDGQVPWKEYLGALKAVGFEGYLTIERETGDDPRADIELAATRLRQYLAEVEGEAG
ncbi:MAG: sugar phosphate isomerase/epimerase [Armatimonadetes bacterium]|nr:sugar phosphate isomerase/epimerase [Armatimonadota bacterium]